MKFFAKGSENCTLLETIFNRQFYDINIIKCPEAKEIATELSKTFDYIGECSSYPQKNSASYIIAHKGGPTGMDCGYNINLKK